MSENEQDQEFEAMLAAALGTSPNDTLERAVESTVPDEDVPPGHKSGYVVLVGRPNAGKSTLINQILHEKIAIVSAKPQTTRIRQLGILTRDDVQVIFVDTPGVHRARDELGTFMVEVAKGALEDADVILFISDTSRSPGSEDEQIMGFLENLGAPEKIIHVLNKVDALRDPGQFQRNFEAYRAMLPDAEFISTVATDGKNVPELVEKIVERLPQGPRYFPRDQVSDAPMRDIAAELIREKVLRSTDQEVPHRIAVEVDEFKRRQNGVIYSHAIIFTERDGQKGIIIGKVGAMLKRISSEARADIEDFVETRVFLEVQVKTLANWRNDDASLRRFGYRL
jgi:GTP-binding protein Era